MGFTKGTVSFQRFKAPAVKAFERDHIDRLENHRAGRQKIASADGIETGWAAGSHVLDTAFALEKNVYPDHLLFDFWVERDRIPGDKLKAYTQIEVAALAKNNPSGFPSARNKREAKEAARERLEQEAKDGRYKKAQVIPVCWDGREGIVYFGSPSPSHVSRFCSLFEQTFHVGIERLTAWKCAGEFAAETSEASPSAFLPLATPQDYIWIADESCRDWLGNEFLLWLWFYLDNINDTISLPDKSEVCSMFVRHLGLDCPRGIAGKDVFSSDGPTRLPEARRAIAAGKLPRSAGLTLVRHDQQYQFRLNAETFAVSGGKLPKAPDDVTETRAKIEDRLGSLRELGSTIDLLYQFFLDMRLRPMWKDVLGEMQEWLTRGGAR